MVEYKIFIEDYVHLKIREFSEYNFRFTFDFSSSENLSKNIYKEIFSLKIFPNRCPNYGKNFRVFLIDKKFKVFYKVYEDKKEVVIFDIFSTSENYLSKIF